MDYRNKKVLVFDYGLFVCLAQRLSRDFGKVFYFSDWENGSPTPDKDHIGFGVPGLIRVDTWEDVIEKEKPDLIVFPDVGCGSMQERERKLGNLVFGTGKGQLLEDDRIFFRKILEKKGLPYSPYEIVTGGIDGLRERLKKVKDKYVKISMYRGVGETFHHVDYNESKARINRLGNILGIFDEQIDIIIEDPIKSHIENVGLEWFVTDEGYLSSGLWGIECKDSGYLGKACSYEEIPAPMKQVADAFLPVYKKYGVRGAISLEGHITEDMKFYYDDPCMRFGSPPGEAICEAYENLSDIMMSVAGGKTIKPVMPFKYVAEVMLKLREPAHTQVALSWPEKYDNLVKIRSLCKMNGKFYHLAEADEVVIGATVGLGNTIKEAENKALEVASQVTGSGVYYDSDCFNKINESANKARKKGIEF